MSLREESVSFFMPHFLLQNREMLVEKEQSVCVSNHKGGARDRDFHFHSPLCSKNKNQKKNKNKFVSVRTTQYFKSSKPFGYATL